MTTQSSDKPELDLVLDEPEHIIMTTEDGIVEVIE
jgi:hypothetical protein